MMNPIVKIRRLATPPCTNCAKCARYLARDDELKCINPKAVDHYERLLGKEVCRVTCSLVRGGRFCKFESRGEE